MSFLNNWVGKKMHGKHYHADDQARNLTILSSNKLGEKLYTTTAPILGLPLARQAQRIRACDQSGFAYMPGLNDWAFQMVAKRELRPLQNSIDGTRVVRIIELYNNKCDRLRENPAYGINAQVAQCTFLVPHVK